jgi:hypothetical protein
MPRKEPPPGFVTSSQALDMLGPMLYKYVKRGILKRYPPPHGTYGYYKLSEIEQLRQQQTTFYEHGTLNGETDKQDEELEPVTHHLEFSQATPDDMEGVYAVAAALFGHTTSAEARKPLVKACPEGNYIIRDNGRIVAYVHMQPLKVERMTAFLRGEFRGSQIRVDDIECFAPGRPANVLIKSIGATGEGKWPSHYIQRLLLGAARDLGSRGINIPKIYATSETATGIAMSIHAAMKSLGKIGRDRYAFELDVASSELPALQIYKRAYAEWLAAHPTAEQPPQRATLPKLAATSLPSTKGREAISRPAQGQTKLSAYASPAELPPGSLSYNDFLESEGLKKYRRRILGYMETWELPHEAFQSAKEREKARYLTPEQQEQLIDWLREHHPDVLAGPPTL